MNNLANVGRILAIGATFLGVILIFLMLIQLTLMALQPGTYGARTIATNLGYSQAVTDRGSADGIFLFRPMEVCGWGYVARYWGNAINEDGERVEISVCTRWPLSPKIVEE